jgi:hypothetical protein
LHNLLAIYWQRSLSSGEDRWYARTAMETVLALGGALVQLGVLLAVTLGFEPAQSSAKSSRRR